MIIGFSGKMGSGKSLAADISKSYLSNRYNLDTLEIKSFAGPLKMMIAAWAGISDWTLLSYPKVKSSLVPDHIARYIRAELPQYQDREGFTFREALQFIGTDIIRAKVPDFWVESTLCNYDPNKVIIIDDCRFIDEADRIRSLGGEVIRINLAIQENFSTHASEVSLDDYKFDHVIINDKSKGKSSLMIQVVSYLDSYFHVHSSLRY